MLIHHSVEDTQLWPQLRRVVGLTWHVHTTSPRQRVYLAERVQELSAALGEHFEHEEEGALPLIQSVLTQADWRVFTSQMSLRQGVKGAAVYVPWILDGSPLAEQRRFLAALPAPVRLINRLWWQPRYRQQNLWNYRSAARAHYPVATSRPSWTGLIDNRQE